MFRTTLKNNLWLTSLLLVAGVVVMALSLSSFTQAQSKKSEKTVTLKDAVERIAPNQIRAKSGFKLIPIEDGWVVEQIAGKETRRLEARVKCGACPGGNCRSRLNGSCVPRNSCTSSGCLIDPF